VQDTLEQAGPIGVPRSPRQRSHPRLERQAELFALADQGLGYFTAQQALALGFDYSVQWHHRQTGAWQEVGHGLFRLRHHPGGAFEDLARLSLWSRNRAGQPQAVVSHQTALAVYELSDLLPAETHLSVPVGFRKPPPAGVVMHRTVVSDDDTEEHTGFRITTTLRTLCDLAASPLSLEHLSQATHEALLHGLVRRGALLEAVAGSHGTTQHRLQLALKITEATP
jgi:predicted transcriptional regulator of viral defense system